MGDKPYATSPPYGGAPPPGVPQYPPQEYDRVPPQYMQAPAPATGVPAASTMVVAATRIPFVPGVQPPAPPAGFAYILKEDCSVCAIILAILFFPWGLLFLLCMRDRYWLLVPVA
ncbi:hypothetical protein BSKO_04716 [Bryopsis sp. KO-2023]|nr:hypothetical protein BSKO_04716 [Bryopsis sp. KO-2023]